MDDALMARPPWLYLWSDLRRDATFFVPLGIVSGLLQLIGYRYFHHADWGTQLLFEHVSLVTLSALGVGLLFLWTLYRRRWPEPQPLTWLMAAMRHGSERAQGLASVGACVCVGFTLVAALSGAGYRLVMFVYFIFYLAGFGEMAANSWRYRPTSRGLVWLIAITIVAPLIGMVMR